MPNLPGARVDRREVGHFHKALIPQLAASRMPDLQSYDHVLVASSGGKDSIASMLFLLEAGVPASRMELHHHEVDGRGPPFMDWPSTAGYCTAIAAAFGIPIYFSWREGGLLREML